MGANIGTTVTGILVSIGHIGRREEFKRAVSGGTLDGFFKMMCVCIIFPLELATGILAKLAAYMSNIFVSIDGVTFKSPIKAVTQPLIYFIKNTLTMLKLPDKTIYILLLVISFIMLFAALYFVVKLMRSMVAQRAEIILSKVIGKYGLLTIFTSLIFTAVIQSSSITIALMIPLIAAGILTTKTMYPLVMGANVGTTITAILASLATGSIPALSVAFVHFLFNIVGLCFIYPIKPLREIPLILTKALGDLAFKKRRYAMLYTLVVFFLIPILVIVIAKMLK